LLTEAGLAFAALPVALLLLALLVAAGSIVLVVHLWSSSGELEWSLINVRFQSCIPASRREEADSRRAE
jgi:hypothetical protein